MILVVDSDKSVAIQVKPRLEEMGFGKVEVIHSAHQAMQFVDGCIDDKQSEPVSLVIIDNEIDDENPNELCRQLRQHEVTKDSHILIVVSSQENKTAIENARHNGASGTIVKPYGSTQFIESLEAYSLLRVVVLVDDDPVIRKLVKRLLRPMKVELIEIDDGLKANNMLNIMLPARVVLMDIGLPGMNGIQLVEKLRMQKQWNKVPVVMLTSSTDAADVKKSLGAGAKDYIAKPFDLENFKTRIGRYLDNAAK